MIQWLMQLMLKSEYPGFCVNISSVIPCVNLVSIVGNRTYQALLPITHVIPTSMKQASEDATNSTWFCASIATIVVNADAMNMVMNKEFFFIGNYLCYA